MNQVVLQNKKYHYKIIFYMLVGVLFELPAAFFSLNKISETKNPVYWNLGCSFLFMFFYLIHYSLKEYKRSKNTRLNRKWGIVFLIIFFMNIFNLFIIVEIVLESDSIPDKNNNSFVYIILLIVSLTQSILTTIDFLITFVKFIYKLIRNHRINNEIQRDILNVTNTNNVATNNTNQLPNSEIRIGLISEIIIQDSIYVDEAVQGIAKYKVTNRDIIRERKEDEECTICLDFVMESSSDNYPLRLPCTHYFHYKCLNSLLAINNKCPNCRKIISV